ncbi:MAG: right-handed parallel beta-helix repeat-containing protein [Anaerovoracaceae bacterium]
MKAKLQKRRLLALLLSVAMVISMMPGLAFAEGEAGQIGKIKIGEKEYPTLAEAIKEAEAGATINISGELSLPDSVTIDKKLNIAGDGTAVIKGNVDNNYAAFIIKVTEPVGSLAQPDVTISNIKTADFGAKTNSNDVITVEKGAVKIDNCTFENFGKRAIHALKGTKVDVNNCVIDVSTKDQVANRTANGVVFNGGSGSVTNTRISKAVTTHEDWRSTGILLWNNKSPELRIENNEITGCDNGICLGSIYDDVSNQEQYDLTNFKQNYNTFTDCKNNIKYEHYIGNIKFVSSKSYESYKSGKITYAGFKYSSSEVTNIYGTLKEAISQAAEGDTIVLCKKEEINGNEEILNIGKEITIDGQGNTIEASSANTEVNCIHLNSGKKVTIKNLNLLGKKDKVKDGIYVDGKANLVLDSVKISNFNGAGITVNGSNATATNLTTSGNTLGGVKVVKNQNSDAPKFTLTSGTLNESKKVWAIGGDNEEALKSFVTAPEGWTTTYDSANKEVQWFPPAPPYIPPTDKPELPKVDEDGKVEVPVNKPDENGKVEADVPDSAVNDALDKVIADVEAGNKENVVVEIKVNTDSKAEAVDVKVDSASIDKIAKTKNATLKVESNVGALELDNDVLKEISKNAGGGKVNISIEKPKVENMPAKQQETIKEIAKKGMVFNLSITAGDKKISNLGGIATLSVDYDLPENEVAEGVRVYFVNDNGEIKPVDAHYDAKSKKIVMSTDHFSVYAVSYVNVPTKVGILRTANDKGRASLRWSRATNDPEGYRVYRSATKDGKYKPIAWVKNGKAKTYKEKAKKTNKTYYYKVRAYKNMDGKKVWGGYSPIKVVKF